MRKGLMFIIFGVCISVTLTWASDIRNARALNGPTQPSLAVSETQMKAIYATGDLLNATERAYIEYDDGNYYNRSGNGYHWDWIMVIYTMEDVTGSYDVSWEGYTDSYSNYNMKAYMWDWGGNDFDCLDGDAPQTIWTSHREFGIPAKYWSWDDDIDRYQCVILIEGYVAIGSEGMHIDVVRVDP